MNPISSAQPRAQQATPIDCPFHYMEKMSPDACLRAAINRNDLAAVTYVLDNLTVDFCALNENGRNPIHSAIRFDRRNDIIKLLIERSVDSNAIHEVDRNGYNPLMIAVERGNIRAAKLLISLRATISGSNDINCSQQGLTEKEQTIVHAKLLLETDGDVPAAHMNALRRGIHSFKRLFSSMNMTLRRDCERGDLDMAKRMVAAGADASFVLVCTLDIPERSLSRSRATLLSNLIAVGADPTVALKYALALPESPRRSAFQSLLMLGASADEAMQSIGKNRNTENVSLLLRSRRHWESALITHAIDGDTSAVNWWLQKTNPNEDRLFIPLATDRRHQAIKLLLSEGPWLKTDSALRRLLDDGNTDAVRSLISAGVDVSTVLREMIDNQQQGLRFGINKLQTLLEAGANVSQMLLESAFNQPDHTLTRLFLAAGASTGDAVALAPEAVRPQVVKALERAARDNVITLRRDIRFPEMTLLEDLVLAQGSRDQRSLKNNNERQKIADELETEGRKPEADLMRAVDNVDWKAITTLARDDDAASKVLVFLLLKTDYPSARLLVQAGMDVSAVVRAARTVPRKDALILAKFIYAGQSAHSVLEFLVDSKMTGLAQDVIKVGRINLFDTFKSLADTGNQSALKKLVPLTRKGGDKVVTACERGHTALAKALISAGAKADQALFHATIDNPDLARKLMAAGADISVTLAEALVNNYELLAELALVLGADPDAALTHVEPRLQSRAEATLEQE